MLLRGREPCRCFDVAPVGLFLTIWSIVSFQPEIVGGQLTALDEAVDMRVHHHRDHRHAAGEQPGCVGVPEVMEVEPTVLLPEDMELRVLERPIPYAPEVAARQRPARSLRATWRGEHVFTVTDEFAVCEEGVDGFLVERDRALARLRLGALHPEPTGVAWIAERADDPQSPWPGNGPVVERPLEL